MSRALAERPTQVERLWTAEDVAQYLGLHVNTVYVWERTGKLPKGRRISGGVLRWSPDKIRAFALDESQAAGA